MLRSCLTKNGHAFRKQIQNKCSYYSEYQKFSRWLYNILTKYFDFGFQLQIQWTERKLPPSAI